MEQRRLKSPKVKGLDSVMPDRRLIAVCPLSSRPIAQTRKLRIRSLRSVAHGRSSYLEVQLEATRRSSAPAARESADTSARRGDINIRGLSRTRRAACERDRTRSSEVLQSRAGLRCARQFSLSDCFRLRTDGHGVGACTLGSRS